MASTSRACSIYSSLWNCGIRDFQISFVSPLAREAPVTDATSFSMPHASGQRVTRNDSLHAHKNSAGHHAPFMGISESLSQKDFPCILSPYVIRSTSAQVEPSGVCNCRTKRVQGRKHLAELSRVQQHQKAPCCTFLSITPLPQLEYRA